MGKKRKRAAPARTCPKCDARVSIKKPSCDCGHVFEISASTLVRYGRDDKRRAAAAATAADERTAAAEEAAKQPPRFLPDSSTKPDTSTKLSLLKVLRLEPNEHPGMLDVFPEYVATKVISCLTCPGIAQKRICEEPYADFYREIVERCEREKQPYPSWLPSPDHVIRECKDGLHSEVQALRVACARGFNTLVGTRGIRVGGPSTRGEESTKDIRYATPAFIAGLGALNSLREVLRSWPTPVVPSDANGLLLQPRRPNAWAATSARFAGGPPLQFFDIRHLSLLELEPSPYSTLAGQLPDHEYVSNINQREVNSFLLDLERPLDDAAYQRRLLDLDADFMEKLRRLPESQIFFDALKLAPVGPKTATGCACWASKKVAHRALRLLYKCSEDDWLKAEKELIKLSGDFEAGTGDVLRVSNALAQYLLYARSLERTEVFLEDGRSLAEITKVDRESCKWVYDADRHCYEVNALLDTAYVVVVKVPGRKTGIAAPGYRAERELTARFAQKYPNLPGRSPWPEKGILSKVIECMPEPYEPSKTAFGVVARHCASGLFGARIMVVSDGVKVATAIVSGARHLYPLESVDLSWRYSLKLLDRCAPTIDKSELGGVCAYGFVRSAYDDRGLAQRATRLHHITCRGPVNDHLMVYSFLFERLDIEIPEGLPRAPPGLLTEEHFDGHSYCTLMRHFGERLSKAGEKKSKVGEGRIDEDTDWWNAIRPQ